MNIKLIYFYICYFDYVYDVTDTVFTQSNTVLAIRSFKASGAFTLKTTDKIMTGAVMLAVHAGTFVDI